MNANGGIDPDLDLEQLGGTMWGVHHALAAAPRPKAESTEGRLELIEIELAVRDVLSRYTYFYDGKDLDSLMGVFHPKCRLVNPRGTYEGAAAIRENYEHLMGVLRIVFHYAPNVMVRVSPDRHSAWLSSYLFSVSVLDEQGDEINGNCSSYVARVVLDEGDWVIREMRITTNVPMELQKRTNPMRSFGTPPQPTSEISSRDWIGDEFAV